MHEKLSHDMTAWLPNTHWDIQGGQKTYYTSCYLAMCPGRNVEDEMGGQKASKLNPLFGKRDDHTAFRQVIDLSRLCLSENQHRRFPKAMRHLNLKPHYHLSEMEPHIIHPLKDEVLIDICSCNSLYCPATGDDRFDAKPGYLADHIERKSKGMMHDQRLRPSISDMETRRNGDTFMAKAYEYCCL
jgi:hypothetical protein